MTALLKQRLVGAIVLISLGIIFIPMLLTGTDSLTTGELPTNIPPKPLYEIQAPAVLPMEQKSHVEPVMEPAPDSTPATVSTEKSEQTSGGSVSAEGGAVTEKSTGKSTDKPEIDTMAAITSTAPVSTTPAMTETKEQGKASVAIEPVSGQKQPVKTDQVEKKVTASRSTAKPDSVPKPESKPATKTSTAKLETVKPKPPIVNGWVVQLGSFSVEKNALKLRDKLRKNGHASFVEQYVREGKTTYRVRVGPELTRELAGKLKTQLKKETRIDGLIMAFPGK